MRNQSCPICGSECCSARGNSNILIIGEFPSFEEIKQNRPFASSDRFITAGTVFRKELQRVGLDFSQFTVMNLWKHIPNKREDCWQDGYNAVLDEAKGKDAILLVGSEVVEAFTKYKVSDVSGLEVDSPILSAPIIFAMPNPALALHRSVGEVRLAIEKWNLVLQKENLL